MRNYFEPKRLELWGERSIYELLGVRFFKRYLLPTERLVNRLRGGKAMRGGQDVLHAELRRLEWETRRNEVIHLSALLLITGILLVKSPQLSMVQLFWILAINLYVNLYPILVQRYNRLRLTRLMRKCAR